MLLETNKTPTDIITMPNPDRPIITRPPFRVLIGTYDRVPELTGLYAIDVAMRRLFFVSF